MTAKEKAAQPAPAPPVENGGSEIDHLRNILFGSHAQATNDRLTELENELPALKKQLLQRLETDLKAVQKEQQDLQQGMKQSETTHQQELAAAQQAIEDQINGTEEAFARRLQELRGEWEQRLQAHQKEITAQLDKLQAAMRRQEEALRAELLAATSWLDERKATRTDLGQMLMELGSQLQANAQHGTETAA